MPVPLIRAKVISVCKQECLEHRVEFPRLFEKEQVTAAFDQTQLGIRYPGRKVARVLRRHNLIRIAADDKCRNSQVGNSRFCVERHRGHQLPTISTLINWILQSS